MSDDISGSDWSEQEADLIVVDYFTMLGHELAGRDYIKAAHNKALQELTGRSRGSIEMKHQNISAVLMRLGLPWIDGYKPLINFQNALVEAVGRYLALRHDPISPAASVGSSKVNEAAALWVGPPPSPLPEDRIETPALRRLIRKFDPAERDARNRSLGKEGEELVLAHERARLLQIGRRDLADRVEWTSEVRGDGAGYDIRSYDADGSERLIEVKTTNGAALTPFFLSENERAFSEERQDVFRLLRIYSFAQKPSAFVLRPPLHEQLSLNPTNYRASF